MPQLPPQQLPVGQDGGGEGDRFEAIETAKVESSFSISFDPHWLHSGVSSEENTRISDMLPQSLHLYSNNAIVLILLIAGEEPTPFT